MPSLRCATLKLINIGDCFDFDHHDAIDQHVDSVAKIDAHLVIDDRKLELMEYLVAALPKLMEETPLIGAL